MTVEEQRFFAIIFGTLLLLNFLANMFPTPKTETVTNTHEYEIKTLREYNKQLREENQFYWDKILQRKWAEVK